MDSTLTKDKNLTSNTTKKAKRTKPPWLKVKLPTGDNYKKVRKIVEDYRLHTICQSGNCPNMGECWGRGTATFMILGNTCTRSCSFCAVATGKPQEYDDDEPHRVAEAIQLMNLNHAVITSVNRDELEDKGSIIWADTIRKIKMYSPGTTIEVLIPDFKADWTALQRVIDENPEVISHNMETVKGMYRKVRPQAKYYRSLEQLRRTKEAGVRTKTGFMLGLGESDDDVYQILHDLRDVNVDVVTIGQYLQPTQKHLNISHFVPPEKFQHFKEVGMEMGFDFVESGPLVRSSYHAERHVYPNNQKKQYLNED